MTISISVDTITEKNKQEASGILNFVDIFLDEETLHYVTNDFNVDFFNLDGNAQAYIALRMVRGEKTEKLDMSIQTLTAGLDNIDQAMSYQISQRNFRDRRIVIRGCFRNLISDAANAWKIFDGYMDKPVITKKEFRVELVPRLGRGTLNHKIGVKQQLFCRYPFASSGGRCAYDIAVATLKDIKTGQVVDSGDTGYIVDAARTEADDYWNYGHITFAADTLTEGLRGVSRMIKDFVAAEDKIYVVIALPAAPQAGDTYSIERGCDHSLESCQNKFNNSANFGGIHTLPAMMVRKEV